MADYTKSAAEITDFTLDWSQVVGADSIITSAWTVPSGITGSNQSSTATTASIRIAAGTASLFYPFVNTITRISGQVDQESLVITVAT